MLLGLELILLYEAGHVDAVTGVAASRTLSVAAFATAAVLTRPTMPVRTLPAVADRAARHRREPQPTLIVGG